MSCCVTFNDFRIILDFQVSNKKEASWYCFQGSVTSSIEKNNILFGVLENSIYLL